MPAARKVQPVFGFRKQGGQNRARVQSVGHVVYDQEYLYIGIGCLEPNPESIEARSPGEPVAAHDDNSVFSYDSVEIMIKPNHQAPEYYQFVRDISDATWDAFRSLDGGTTDPDWNAAMTPAVFREKDDWSVEVRLCRRKQKPHELSAIAREGIFNEAHKFTILSGIDIDLSRYFIEVGRPQLVGEIRPTGPSASELCRSRAVSRGRRPGHPWRTAGGGFFGRVRGQGAGQCETGRRHRPGERQDPGAVESALFEAAEDVGAEPR